MLQIELAHDHLRLHLHLVSLGIADSVNIFLRSIMSSFGSTALYLQLADRIEALIRAGALGAGERIPAVRRTSVQHRVSVTTAVQAYLELENRGLIEAHPRSGFFVKPQIRNNVLLEPTISRPATVATAVG